MFSTTVLRNLLNLTETWDMVRELASSTIQAIDTLGSAADQSVVELSAVTARESKLWSGFTVSVLASVCAQAFSWRNQVLANVLKCACVLLHYAHAHTWPDFESKRSDHTSRAAKPDLLNLTC